MTRFKLPAVLTVGSRPARNRALGAILCGLVAITAAVSTSAAATAQTAVSKASSAPQTYSIFADSTPKDGADPDNQPVELGVKFVALSDGWITAIRYYKFAEEAAATRGTLWSDKGDVLAQAGFEGTTSQGWQSVKLDQPVEVSAGQTYVASYFAPKGRYAADEGGLNDATGIQRYALKAVEGVYSYRGGLPTRSWNDANYFADVTFTSADPDVTAPPAPTTTPKPTTATPTTTAAPPTSVPPTSPKPTTATPTTSAAPTTVPTAPGGFPGASNTGVPSGTTLSNYSGPCTITVANTVIDAKTVNCSLSINASGVQISRSKVNGSVATYNGSFTMTDSEVNAGGSGSATGVGDSNFTVLRSEIYGGNRGGYCDHNCLIQDSWIHGQIVPSGSGSHSSGLRASQDTVYRHNTIACDAQDNSNGGGCSAAVTMYGDYAPVQRVTIESNLIKAGSGGYCSYGGSSGGKPYSSGAGNITYRNNVFERGSNGKCGVWGAITAFDPSRPGNVWTGNVWDDGALVASAN